MFIRSVFDKTSISRRGAMSTLAGAGAVLTSLALRSTAASAQTPEWHDHRDNELGFRVEVPARMFALTQMSGEFTLTEPPLKVMVTRWTHVRTRFDGMTLDAHGMEFRGTPPAEGLSKWQREGKPTGGKPASREEECTVSGVPGRQFIREADDTNFISRLVVVDNRAIVVSVSGARSIHGNPTASRFLDSLTLLRGGR